MLFRKYRYFTQFFWLRHNVKNIYIKYTVIILGVIHTHSLTYLKIGLNYNYFHKSYISTVNTPVKNLSKFRLKVCKIAVKGMFSATQLNSENIMTILYFD